MQNPNIEQRKLEAQGPESTKSKSTFQFTIHTEKHIHKNEKSIRTTMNPETTPTPLRNGIKFEWNSQEILKFLIYFLLMMKKYLLIICCLLLNGQSSYSQTFTKSCNKMYTYNSHTIFHIYTLHIKWKIN